MKKRKYNALPAIVAILETATVAHDGYRMRNKLHHHYQMDYDGETIQGWMAELADNNQIERAPALPDDEYVTYRACQ